MNGLAVVILAAGQGKRMKSTLPKVLHRVAGVPMLRYALDIAQRLNPDVIIPVIGHKREQVRGFLTTQEHRPLRIVETAGATRNRGCPYGNQIGRWQKHSDDLDSQW